MEKYAGHANIKRILGGLVAQLVMFVCQTHQNQIRLHWYMIYGYDCSPIIIVEAMEPNLTKGKKNWQQFVDWLEEEREYRQV